MILGIDEVGRGPWAGPLVVGAVVLGGKEIDGLNDSKKLTKKRCIELDREVRNKAAAWALGWVSASELDELGISSALRLATRRAVEAIQIQCRERGVRFDEIIIDGTVNFLRGTALADFVTTMPKADGLIPSVSAASIIAKVARDMYMHQQDAIYPGYGFASNAGYGVAKHRAAIEELGVCPEHRLSFAPLAKYAGLSKCTSEQANPLASPPVKISRRASCPSSSYISASVEPGAVEHCGGLSASDSTTSKSSGAATLTTKTIGDRAEDLVATELESRGHIIVARNWRTRWCEIDIISMQGNTIFFTEVKYRKNNDFGGGVAAITAKKQRQMRFAAEFFISKNQQFSQRDLKLLAVDVSGEPPVMREIIEIE